MVQVPVEVVQVRVPGSEGAMQGRPRPVQVPEK